MAALIELEGVGRAFAGEAGADARALADVSLTIEAGEFVCVAGPSGAGKSTLLHILRCLDRPTEGVYRFAGEDVGGLDADALAGLRRDAFGFVFQARETPLLSTSFPAAIGPECCEWPRGMWMRLLPKTRCRTPSSSCYTVFRPRGQGCG